MREEKEVNVRIVGDPWTIDRLLELLADRRVVELEMPGGHGLNREHIGTVLMKVEGD